jgi:sirohydrochlorin ferrochelatase
MHGGTAADGAASPLAHDGDVPSRDPVLVVCAHGTRSAAGQATYAALADAVRAAAPGQRVEPAYVDILAPDVGTLVAALDDAGERVVVVPLLLSYGFHVGVDVAKAVAGRPRAVAAGHLGPSPLLAGVLRDRLAAIDVEPAAVVLAAAGSSDPAAVDDTTAAAILLADLIGVPVTAGYGSSASPSVADAVVAARAETSGPVAVAAYLLAPGYFHGMLAGVGADAVTAPLCSPADIPDDVVQLVLARYTAALATF